MCKKTQASVFVVCVCVVVLFSTVHQVEAGCKTATSRMCQFDWNVDYAVCGAINDAKYVQANLIPLDANNCGKLAKADGNDCAQALAKVICSHLCNKCNGNARPVPNVCGSVCENLAQSCKQASNAGCFKTIFSKCIADGTTCSSVDVNSDYAHFDTTTTTTTTGGGGSTGVASSPNFPSHFLTLLLACCLCVLSAIFPSTV